MDVKYDFSDVKQAIEQMKGEVRAKMGKVGAEAVQYAKDFGNYQDQTGRLRASNEFEASEDGLTLKNTAPYASKVESKGYDVLSGAILYAEKRLKEEFE